MPPAAGDPVAVVAAAGAVFTGTLACSVSVSKGIGWSIPRIKRWRNPPSIRVSAESGMYNGTLTLTHVGETTTWKVDGKIVRTLNNSKNPNPSLFECNIYREGKTSRSIELRDGEWAQITLAHIGNSEFGNPPTWLEINHRGGLGTTVPDDGVVVELIFRAQPRLKNGPIKKCFEITRPGRMRRVEVVPLSGD
jgi:hypothetical protein